MLDALCRLPEPQQEAAGGVRSQRGARPDQFLVDLAVLGLFAEVARDRPMVCLLDDAQWLDRASAEALPFVARRLRAESVAMIFAVRESASGPTEVSVLAGVTELQLRGLPEREARDHGRDGPQTQR